ncbi:AzlC family ABC transporter permease [Planococcus halotolerans]|uniref:Branched-chain amino acid ABC transporter permease n=1 Tax=Planococcus halotolerans TaxID=2233542 RepID=A0A365L2T7_9BACL|nr:AzlC family ABC transporter permease [Planococcus halotolerans]QHJ70728.1 branched-chain amino acid ABC transporter permease [Planococcus halotolerans]RAZ79515.1 branched-chain amino acid ABC transporter permease [Planococcus halotolerans]
MEQRGFSAGLKAGVSIAIGYFPVALTFGLLAKTTGLSLLEATAMSIFVFAGAAQYISLTLITAGVAPAVIILNTFIVNIRHFLMTASLNEKMQPDARWKKALYAFGITDESFSVLAIQKEDNLRTTFAAGVIVISYGSWVVFTALGHLIGANLPEFLQAAMSIALYALFVGLLVPSMRGNRKVVSLAAIAALLNSLFFFTGWLTTGWAILVSTLASAIIIELIASKGGRS